jgi:hypothetical protein
MAQAVSDLLQGKEIKPPTKKEKKKSFSDFTFGAAAFAIYTIGPLMMLGLAYRCYWRHGLFWTNEHLFLFGW